MVYEVPDVYVEEIRTLPPSVAPVATAIPAFIGFTQKAIDENGDPRENDEVVIRRIETMYDFTQFFGGPPSIMFNLVLNVQREQGFQFKKVASDTSKFLLYYAMKSYFDNGGGDCYIVSVGSYDSLDKGMIEKGLMKLLEIDEPTILLSPDAVTLAPIDYYSICEQMLNQCNELKDRFAIFDILENDNDGSEFRDSMASPYLNYGAAYKPFLQTTYSYEYEESQVDVSQSFLATPETINGNKTALSIAYPVFLNGGGGEVMVEVIKANPVNNLGVEITEAIFRLKNFQEGITTVQEIVDVWENLAAKGTFEIVSIAPSSILSQDSFSFQPTGFITAQVEELIIKKINVFDDGTTFTVNFIANSDPAVPDFVITPNGLQIKITDDEGNMNVGNYASEILGRMPTEGIPGYELSVSDPTLSIVDQTPISSNQEAILGGFTPDGNFIAEINNDQGAEKILEIKYNAPENSNNIPEFEFTSEVATVIKFEVLEGDGISKLTLEFSEGVSIEQVLEAWKQERNKGLFEVSAVEGETTIIEMPEMVLNTPASPGTFSLATIKDRYTQRYNQYRTALTNQRVIIPPTAAVAGLYARVDRDRGVWKAPANESLLSVIAPTSSYSFSRLARFNVDPTSGKSINIIRSKTGRGTLVMGGRTLAGNDNEWRYVNVRRLFIFIEESVQNATEFVVFEPNTATTWLKVKGLIESFLYQLWQQGALAGPTPEAAYFVTVGLGKTMNQQDILEGRLIVEVGIAASRPAEFIILRFSHKLQEA